MKFSIEKFVASKNYKSARSCSSNKIAENRDVVLIPKMESIESKLRMNKNDKINKNEKQDQETTGSIKQKKEKKQNKQKGFSRADSPSIPPRMSKRERSIERTNEKRQTQFLKNLRSGKRMESGYIEYQALFNIGLDDEVLLRLDNVTALMDMLMARVGHATDDVGVFVQQVGAQAKAELNKWLFTIAFTICVTMLIKGKGHGMWIGIPLLIAVCVNDIPQKLKNAITELVSLAKDQINGGVARQALDPRVVELASKTFYMLFSWVNGRSSRNGSITEFMKAAAHYEKTTDGLTSIAEDVSFFLSKAISMFKKDVMGYDVDDFLSMEDEFALWYDKVDGYIKKKDLDELSVNLTVWKELTKLRDEGEYLLRKIPTGKAGAKVRHLMNWYLGKVTKLMGPFLQQSFSKSGIKFSPLTVCLMGSSGVGKSAMSVPLVEAVLAEVLDEDELERFADNSNDFLYSRNFEQEYWDGYHQQHAVIFDDFLQAMGNQSADCEEMNIIRATSEYPYALHMSSIEDKGNVYFNSRLILASTNSWDLSTNNIKEGAALYRRFDAIVEVYPKKEFSQDPSLDLPHRKLIHMDEFNDDVWEFHVRTSKNMYDKSSTITMDMASLTRHLIQLYRQKHNYGENYKDSITALKKSKIAQRLARQRIVRQGGIISTPWNVTTDGDDTVAPDNTKAVAALKKCVADTLKVDESDVKYFVTDVEMKDFQARHGFDEKTIRSMSAKYVELLFTAIYENTGGEHPMEWAFNKVRESSSSVLSKYPFVKWMLAIMPILGIVWYFGRSPEVKHDGQSIYERSRKIPHPRSVKTRVWRHVNAPHGPRTYVPQARELNPNLEAMAARIVREHIYTMVVGDRTIGNVIALRGPIFCSPAHYWDMLAKYASRSTKDARVEVVKLISLQDGAVESQNILTTLDTLLNQRPNMVDIREDRWFFRLRCRNHRDLMRNLPSKGDLDKFRDGIPTAMFIPGQEEVTVVTSFSALYTNNYHEGTGKFEDALCTPISTKFGECGSVLFLDDGTGQNLKLLAFHFGALQDCTVALASILYKEVVLKACKELDYEIIDQSEVQFQSIAHEFFDSQPASKEERVHIARSTKLRPSPVFEVFGKAVRMPATLTKSGDIDPFDKALNRYKKVNFPISPEIVDLAYQNYFLRKVGFKAEPRLLSIQEAIAGSSELSHIFGITRSTSPGFPWVKKTHKKGKTEFFGQEGEYDLSTPLAVEVIARVESVISDAAQGIRHKHLYMDSMKDELRPLHKVALCDTRLISGCPLDLTIAFRMYFGDFANWIIGNRINNGVAVGVNPFSPQWAQLARMLQRWSPHIVAGDFSAFDGTQSSSVLEPMVNFINRWYGDGETNARVRTVLWHEVWNSRHLHGGDILIFDHCLPSGHPLTTIINSIYVQVIMRIAWLLCHDLSLGSMLEFDNHVLLVSYGDDNIMSISDNAIDMFNYLTIEMSLAKVGLTYTAEDKGEINRPSKSLEEVTFLKRFLVDREGRPTCRLELSTVLEMGYWYRSGEDIAARIRVNIENFLKELSIWDTDTYSKYAGTLIAKAAQHGFYFEDCQEMWRGRITLESHLDEDGQWIDDLRGDLMNCDQKEVFDDVTDLKVPEFSLLPTRRHYEEFPGGHTGHSLESGIVFQSGLADNKKETADGSQNPGPETLTVIDSAGLDTPNVNVSDTTLFAGDGMSKLSVPLEPKVLDNHLQAGEALYHNQSIKDFLAKPVLLHQMDWATTATANQVLYTYAIPTFDASTGSPRTRVWVEKLQGYLGFRGNANIRVQVNANRFCQGRLLLHYIPFGQLNPTEVIARNYDLRTKTQQPNIQLNANRDTDCTLTIPYVSPTQFYNLETGDGPWGIFYITVYSPLRSTTVGAVSVTVWLSFDEVELCVPTFIDIQRQGTMEEEEAKKPETPSTWSRFSGFMSKHKVASRGAGGLARISKWIGNEIPALSPIARPAEWVLSAVGRAASSFGWSMPLNPSAFVRNSPWTNAYPLNCNQFDNSMPMGLFADHKISTLPGFAGTDVDELSIRYIANKVAYWKTYSWTSSSAVNSSLFRVELKPSTFQDSVTLGGPCTSYSPIAFLQSFFRFWRGSINIHIKIVKTEFHTGRLLLVYQPTTQPKGALDMDDTNFMFRQVLDIREKDEFHITVPYASHSPWMRHNEFMGFLHVIVLNKLNAPDSVPNSVDMLIEVSGGEDLRFGGLRTVQHYAVRVSEGFAEDGTPISKEGEIATIEEFPSSDITGIVRQGAAVSTAVEGAGALLNGDWDTIEHQWTRLGTTEFWHNVMVDLSSPSYWEDNTVGTANRIVETVRGVASGDLTSIVDIMDITLAGNSAAEYSPLDAYNQRHDGPRLGFDDKAMDEVANNGAALKGGDPSNPKSASSGVGSKYNMKGLGASLATGLVSANPDMGLKLLFSALNPGGGDFNQLLENPNHASGGISLLDPFGTPAGDYIDTPVDSYVDRANVMGPSMPNQQDGLGYAGRRKRLRYECRDTLGFSGSRVPIASQSGMFAEAPATKTSPALGQVNERTITMTIGNAEVVNDEYAAEEYCMGEVILSLRQLLKRRTELRLDKSSTTSVTCIVRPYSIGGTVWNGSWEYSGMSGDWLSAIAPLYLLNRGTVKMQVNSPFDYGKRSFSSIEMTESVSSSQVYWSNNTAMTPCGSLNDTVYVRGNHEVSIPCWNMMHSRLVRVDYENSPKTIGAYDSAVQLLFGNITSSGSPRSEFKAWRRISDDFDLGFFIGVPVMRTEYTVQF